MAGTVSCALGDSVWTGGKKIPERIVQHWHRSSRKVVGYTFLEVFKTLVGRATADLL